MTGAEHEVKADQGGQQTERLAVITLVQRADFPTAWSSIQSVGAQLSTDRRRFILLNDSYDSHLESSLEQMPWTEVLCVGKNVGVAAGRNVLIEQAMEWGADLIVTLDDDLLVPCDYLDRLEVLMGGKESSTEGPDIATPVLLDYHAVARDLHSEDQIRSVETGQVAPFMRTLATHEVLEAWKQLEELGRLAAVHHMGIRDWVRHYFAPLGPAAQKLSRAISDVTAERGHSSKDLPPTELKNDQEAVRSAILGEGQVVEIDCAPGGATVYRRSAIERVGLLEEAFSPFGYEDAEICIRAQRTGSRVALLEPLIVLHDLQSRHKRRDPLVTAATRGKARALLLRNHGGDRSSKASLGMRSLVVGSLESSMYSHVDGGVMAGLFAFVVGALNGFFARSTIDGTGLQETRGDPPFVWVGRPTIHLAETPDADGLQPKAFSGYAPFAVKTRPVPLAASLGSHVSGTASLTYLLDESGVLHVDSLRVSVQNLLELRVRAQLSGFSPDGEPVDPLSNTRLHSLEFDVVNRGFFDRFESSRAWLGGWPSRGVFRSMAAALPGREGAAIRAFLGPWSGPSSLHVEILPDEPFGYDDLNVIDGGPWHFLRRLGIRVRTEGVLPSAWRSEEGVQV